MDKFTASNGVEVKRRRNEVVFTCGMYIVAAEELAAREFFHAERDEALGRWRWPENPNVVAWASRRTNEKDVTVFDEAAGYVGYFERADVTDAHFGEGLIRGAARAYFEAHPERKPWEDAQDGEVWLIDCAGTPEGGEPFIVHLGKFKSPTTTSLVVKNDPTITAARKVFPESD